MLSSEGTRAWLHAYRRRVTWFVAALLFPAVLAWLLPVSNPADTNSIADRLPGDAPRKLPPEDLAAFLDVKRWGISLREINARIAKEEAQRLGSRSDLNPALKALGYVGLLVEADANTVLLTTTEGMIARLEPGDALPDGRVLAEVQGNSITLRAADGGEVEVLELFPRPPPQTED
ncbi:MAG: hypothetical protein OXQ29_16350 [Rhodospirillaceae bacterium]|nr:hypothetical protein [Rhodospirillaceae bacterium]